METVLKTAPTKEPILIIDAKRHCRIDLDRTDEDAIIGDLIVAARDYIEAITWRKLITQSWYVYLDDWPSGDYIELPFGKLQSVTTVKYTDVDNSQSTWNSSEYIVGTEYQKGRITLEDGYTWPNEVLYPSAPIEIDFTCGYGDSAANIPADLKRAIYIMIAELYENRENSIVGVNSQKLELVESLITNYRLNEL